MKKFLLIFSIAINLLFAQNTLVQTFVEFQVDNSTKKISAFKKNEITFIAAKDFAEFAGINYYINTNNNKIEYKFDNYSLVFTARNPFITLTNKPNNEKKVYQLPISTFELQNQIYIPIDYVQNYLNNFSTKQIKFNLTGVPILTSNDEKDKENENIKVKEETTSLSTLNYTIEEKANGTLITLRANEVLPKINHSLSKNIIELNLYGKNFNINNIGKGKGLVKEINLINDKEKTSILLYLNQGYSTYEVLQKPNTKEALITIHSKIFSKSISTKKDKWIFDVIVIDAGHGGKDYGAIGVSNAIEKEINLSVALKLGKLIEEKMKNVKVVYTRNNDTFVELYKRGKIANENNGKLFISIHCNSTPKKNKNADGYEIYLLRPGRTEEAIDIAERENSVINYEDNPKRYQKLTDENFILVSMAHSSYMKYSEKFSELLNKHFSQNIKINSRGVKQAGFYVLVGASMPSVLIETGFISNPSDAQYLKSSTGQNEIAQSIFNAIGSFKTYYDTVFESE
ncbi:MAG: hypothetical protein STSR0008_08880 [Ignavibacterium sp.]